MIVADYNPFEITVKVQASSGVKSYKLRVDPDNRVYSIRRILS